jgi:hypothetical protein
VRASSPFKLIELGLDGGAAGVHVYKIVSLAHSDSDVYQINADTVGFLDDLTAPLA